MRGLIIETSQSQCLKYSKLESRGATHSACSIKSHIRAKFFFERKFLNFCVEICLGVSNDETPPTEFAEGVPKMYQRAFLTCSIIFLDKRRPALAPR